MRRITQLSYILFFFFLLLVSFSAMSQTDKEFWFGAPEITSGHGDEPISLRVSALKLDADVTVEIPAAGITIDNITLPAGESAEIDLTPYKADLENSNYGVIEDKGLHVTSTTPITAYYELKRTNNPDIFSLKGDNATGTEFYTPFQNQWPNGSYTPQPYCGFIIVATENNTDVTIDPSNDIQGHPGPGLPDSPFTITLDKGQSFACVAAGTAANDHLMGSYISSNKKITVTKYDDSSTYTSGGCRDVIGDQLVPTDVIGYEYIATKTQLSSDERVFILGTESNTDIYTEGTLDTTIGAGETYSYELIDEATHIEGTKPIYVLHVGGYGCELGGALLPTIDGCTGSFEVYFARSSTQDFFMNLLIRSGPAESTFYLEYEDGSTHNLPSTWFDPVPNTGGDWMYLSPPNNEFDDNTIGGVPFDEVTRIYNTLDVFHMGFNNGGTTTGCNYGYFSDFKEADANAGEAGTDFSNIRKCFGIPIQLRAKGGVSYHWSPETYLDDPNIATPVLNAVPGTHLYEVSITRPCFGDTTMDVTVEIYERVDAKFSVDQAYGCSPLEVEITDECVGADTTKYRWEYGDGSPINHDYDSVHTHTYTNTTDTTQQYRLSLLVKNEDDCVDTLGRTITVEPSLDANLEPSPDTIGCNPLPVQFRNSTTGGNMDSTTYQWEFGDGNSSSDSIPIHTFQNPSGSDTTYTTIMTAESKFGCLDFDTTEITVHSYINASFTLDTIEGCSPLTIHPDAKSYPGIEDYKWYFESLDTTTFSAPSYDPGPRTYINRSGTSDTLEVKLVVKNPDGCQDSMSREVIIHPEVHAEFAPMDIASCNPVTVDYTNQSTYRSTPDTAGLFYQWDFGDGNTSTAEDPVHKFTNSSFNDTTYNVNLEVVSPRGCTHDTTGSVEVYSYLKADFSASNVKGCSPLEVSVTNNSVGNIDYYWFWNDDDLTLTNRDSIISDPSFTKTYVNRTGEVQEKWMTLIVENTQNCRDTIQRKITIYPEVTADFSPKITEGCNPFEFTYNNDSHYTDTTNTNNLNYSWDFDDGGSSSETNPTHTFTNSLPYDTTYNVELAVASDDGCVDTTDGTVTVNDYIKADFSVDEPVGCAPFTITIDEYASGGIDSYEWDWGDGTDSSYTTPTTPFTYTYQNKSDTIAIFPLTLVVDNNDGCEDTLTRDIKVYPDVEPDFGMSDSTGCHPVQVDFTNNSTPDTDLSYTWDFGDGGTSNQDSVSHTFTNFSNTGDSTYTVSLIAESDYYCRDTIYDTVEVYHNPKAKMSVNETESCPPLNLEAENQSTGGDTYTWSFGDGTDSTLSNTDPVDNSYDNTDSTVANFDLQLLAETTEGCQDSTQLRLSVYPRVIADFDVKDGYDWAGCHPHNIEFDNQTDNADYYSWDFDDGVTSNLVNPVNRFENTSQSNKPFDVELQATSEFNCADTVSKPVTVYPSPNAAFAVTPTLQIFPNSTVSLDNNTNHTDAGLWNYSWDFGDGGTSAETQPEEYTYEDWGEYDITLEAESAQCYDSVTHSIIIIAPEPIANFTTDPMEGCQPLTVQFNDNSMYADDYHWDFDDGDTSKAVNPEHTFTEAGTFYVKQSISGEGGEDYDYQTIRVFRKPIADFEVEPKLVMLPDEQIACYNLSKYEDTYKWNFGDGGKANIESPKHLYRDTGKYDIRLEIASFNECRDTLVKEDIVHVVGQGQIKFPDAFTPNKSGPSGGEWKEGENIDKLNDIFHPIGEGVIEYKLEIFNKWGEKIYESNDFHKGWDGYYQGELQPQDVYIWKAEGKFSNGKTFEKMGDVTLIR